jgi:hypothetical protein
MTTMRRYGSLKALFGCLAIALGATGAHAGCTVTSVQSITGLNANLGTYTTAGGATATLSTVTVTVNKPVGTGGCPNLRLAFLGPAKPAAMAGPSTPKLLYDVQTTGGTSILYTGAPGSTLALTNPSETFTDTHTSYSMTATVVVKAASGQSTVPNGPYTDANVVAVVLQSVSPLPGPQPPLLVSATVNNPRSCTVGGSATPSAGTATIPISTTGRVASIAPITPNLSNTAVSCTGLGAASIDLSSLNGRLTGPANTNASFANAIDYTATASVTGGSLTATAASYVSSTGASTPGLSTNLGSGAVTGNLVVSVTPVDPGKPLLAGSYSDTLTVRILPQ